MPKKSTKRNIGLFLLGLAVAGGFAAYAFNSKLQPEPSGQAVLVRYEKKMPLSTILHDLQEQGIIRSAAATGFYARLKKKEAVVDAGTYSVAPGMDAEEILRALRNAVSVKVTIPEYFRLEQTADRMDKDNVAKADDFVALAEKPSEFSKSVDFPLPANSLEGYLFPDTYKVEPKVGAKAAIVQMLGTFEKRVWKGLGEPKNLNRIIIIASMVERETKMDVERPIIAGIIENRLAKGMPLEIDATVLYAEKHWHQPTHDDIKNTISPYNTYLNKGLPPGPICSPGLKSIKAALHPAKTDYLYYVGMPDGHSLFAKSLQEHDANIAKRRQALRRARESN